MNNACSRNIPKCKPCIFAYIPVTALLLLAAFLLCTHLAADAPSDASDSAGLHFDPPSKCHNARNKVLFGDWVIDEWTPFIHSPVQTLLQAGIFSVAGTGSAQMRLLSVVASLLSLLLIFVLTRKDFGYGVALVALTALTFSSEFWVYGRSGLLEPLVMLGMLGTAWAIRNGYEADKDNNADKVALWFLLAAVFGMATLLSKVISATFLASAAIAICIWPPKRKRSLVILFSAFAAMLVLYFGPFMHINAPFFERESTYWADRASSSNHLKLWLTQPLFYTLKHTSALTHLAVLAIIWSFFGLRDPAKRTKLIIPAIMAIGLIVGSQFLSIVSYRPQRYYVPLLIPIAILAASSISQLAKLAGKELSDLRPCRGKSAVAFIVLTFLFSLSPIGPMRLLEHHVDAVDFSPGSRMLFTAVAVLAVKALWFLLKGSIARAFYRIPSGLRIWVTGVCIVLALVQYARINSYSFRHWNIHPLYGMRDFGEMLGTRYRDLHIAGITPLFAVMDNKHHAYKVTDYNLNWNVMTNGTVTHLIIPTQFGHHRFFSHTFSDVMKKATVVDQVKIGPHPSKLYAIALQPAVRNISSNTDGLPLLTITNPDPYTPQTFTLITPDTGGNDALTTSEEWDLYPNTSRSHVFDSREALETSYIIPRSAWHNGPLDIKQAKRIRNVTDPQAWEIDAIALEPSESSDHTSIVAVSPDTSNRLAYAGVRLRGEVQTGDIITLEWIENDQTLRSYAISPDVLSDSRYHSFVIQLQQKHVPESQIMRIRIMGGATLYADAMLFVPESNLTTFRLQ